MWQTAYQNLSGVLSAGGCRSQGESAAWAADAADKTAGRLACALGCQEHEPVLARAFEPWWDHKMPTDALEEACRQVGEEYSLAFMGAIVQGRVFWKCCSKGGTDRCDPSLMNLGASAHTSDRDLLLTLVAELADMSLLPDMYFVFNTGDQPFTDKTYWSPVPQFHWVKCAGHWTIPLPNPFQLKAHFANRLGDSSEHEAFFVPWEQKVGKVYWRGSFSGPDHLLSKDMYTLPRLRLLQLVAQHPELFNVGITGVDEEVKAHMGQQDFQELMSRLTIVKHENSQREQPRHRYVINVAAVLSSWRLSELLASGSVLLLQDDASSELIYEWLTPWEHFVPISNGLSDLVAKIQWLEAHPAQAQAIAERGLQFFKSRVRRQDTYCYIWQAMSSLARATELRPLPKPGKRWTEVRLADMAERAPQHTPLRALLGATSASGAAPLEL